MFNSSLIGSSLLPNLTTTCFIYMVFTTHSLIGLASFIHVYTSLSPTWYCTWPCPFLLFHCFYTSMLFHWLMLPYHRSYKIFNISPFWYYMYYLLDLWLDNIYLDKQDLQFIFYLLFWYFFFVYYVNFISFCEHTYMYQGIF